ncbi:MAG: oligoendopeptidase F, partial [Solibacillus sp.]
MSKKVLTREEVPEQLTWDLTTIFATDDAWEVELKEVEKLSEQATDFKGKVADSAESLYNTLQFSNQLMERLHKLYVYSHLKHDQDTTNSKYQDLDGRIRSVAAKMGATWSFITPEILGLDEETLDSYVASYEPLGLYKQSLKELNLGRPHVLSAEKEELLAQLSEVS